jgi:hypothetical protein
MPLQPARNTIEADLMSKRRIGAEIMTDTNYPDLDGKVAVVTRGPEGIGAAASRTIEAKGGSPNNAAIARRNGSAGQARLHADGRCSRLGQGEEAKEALHRLPLALDLDLPRTQCLVEGATLVDHCSQSGWIALYDRIGTLYTPAFDLQTAIPNYSAEAVLAETQFVARVEPLRGMRIEHRPERENEGVNTKLRVTRPRRRARTPASEPYDDRLELLAPLCELVDPGSRRRGKLAPPYYPRSLELPEALGEDVGARSGQACPEVGEALGTEQQLAYDQQSPPLANEVESVRRRACVAVCTHGNHTRDFSTGSPELHFSECFTQFTGSFLGLLPYAPSRR